jgi:class 3 adenylate cyclase/tetratricopeptide (TPR) repeat protein
MDDITRWLEGHGLGKYLGLFEESEITFSDLHLLTEDDVRELNLPLGPRRRLLAALDGLRSDPVASLDHGAEATGATTSADAERRQLTVMFCDLVGSTALSEDMDPEDYRDVIAAYQTAVTATVTEHEGYLARFMGDGLLVYFGYPNAQETDPERATRAGLAIVEAVGSLQFTPPLEVRLGIATGPVVVGDIIGEGASEEVAVLGETPNLAARLQGAAAPNTVLISPTTQRLVRGRVETQALEPMPLKGLTAPVVPYRALRSRSLSEVSSSLSDSSPLVGRDVEVVLLKRAWAHACSSEGQVVLLSAEAGVGKSRLLRAFQESIKTEHPRRVQWHCSPYHRSTPHFPATEQIKRSIRFDRDDPNPGARLGRLETMLSELGLDAEEMVPLLARWLSIPVGDRYALTDYSAEEGKRRVLMAQIELLLAAARQSPVLFIVEDLHWADASTIEVVGEMVNAIAEARVLMVVTARPEFAPPWDALSNSTTHRLNSLTKSETRALVRGIVAEEGLAAETVERIVERSDGVPLFIEEVTKSLLESSGDGSVPSSLKDSLMARLDRLGETKELAQMASVIGRSFFLDALCGLAERPRDVIEQELARLFDAGLVHRRANGEYAFKHALIRDAAYDSMLRNARRTFHGRYAAHLSAHLAEQGADEGQPALLALHYSEAGNVDAAIEHWTRAGDMALANAAQAESAEHFQHALMLLGNLAAPLRRPTEELSILLRLGQAQYGALGGGAPATMATYIRAAELAEDFGSSADMCRAQYGQCSALLISGRTLDVFDVTREIARLAVDSETVWAAAVANRMAGAAYYMTGQLDEARKALEHVMSSRDVLALGQAGFGHDPYITAGSMLGLVEWTLGFPQSAIERCERAVAEVERVAVNPNTVAYALLWRMQIGILCRQQDLLSRSVHALRAFNRRARRFGMPVYMIGEGGFLVRSGRVREGLTILETSHQESLASGSRQLLPLVHLLEAEGHLAAGDVQRCHATLAVTEELIAQTSNSVYQPEVYRLRGNAWMLEGDFDSAESSYLSALELARSQNAMSWQLRAATDLAELWGQQGKRDDAIGLLSPILSWFTEGLDMPDLMDAKQLLDRLERN